MEELCNIKKISFFILFFFLLSCKEDKIEFVQSKVDSSLFLIKNPPFKDSLLKKEISLFLIKNLQKKSKKKDFYARFYKYTWGTSYFLENEEDDGGPTSLHFLDNYNDDNLASFFLSKCENDTTKLVGKFHFYGLKGLYDGVDQTDTLLYKCN